jgi:hypothetical protein
MFSLFVNDFLNNFWANKPNDIFISNTCRALKLNEGSVDLNFYFGLDSVPQFYEFDANKNLILKNEVKTIVEESSVNELGETIVTQNEVVTYEAYKTIEPIVYFAKGLMIRPC